MERVLRFSILSEPIYRRVQQREADPSGTHYVWKANAIGQDAKSVCEILEKNYADESIEVEDLTIKLVMKALLEVV
ncbi:Proteasome subunit alpha type-7 [Myotis davidii]|uniref:Proteasome subunit alpha type-7 n=1 Tax=Myotis davidii TaxID=225400 RepID=L5LY62_MYODS|nr:Proteasome subunit alpha type-7 [Myotis davidii]